jgi:hypothetical protein
MATLITQDEFRRRFGNMGLQRFRLLRKRPDFPKKSPFSRPNKLLWLDEDADTYIRKFLRSGEALPAMGGKNKASARRRRRLVSAATAKPKRRAVVSNAA